MTTPLPGSGGALISTITPGQELVLQLPPLPEAGLPTGAAVRCQAEAYATPGGDTALGALRRRSGGGVQPALCHLW
jgi:hypothetical protein